MSSVIVVHVDGLFCDTSFDVPSVEADLHAVRWYESIYRGAREQMIVTCDSPKGQSVGAWLNTLGVSFSTVFAGDEEANETQRCERIMKHIAAQHSKIVLFVGARVYDCNWMADVGVPSLRYISPNLSGKAWEPDPRSAWVKTIEKQQA